MTLFADNVKYAVVLERSAPVSEPITTGYHYHHCFFLSLVFLGKCPYLFRQLKQIETTSNTFQLIPHKKLLVSWKSRRSVQAAVWWTFLIWVRKCNISTLFACFEMSTISHAASWNALLKQERCGLYLSDAVVIKSLVYVNLAVQFIEEYFNLVRNFRVSIF